jgi:hypothetical protein
VFQAGGVSTALWIQVPNRIELYMENILPMITHKIVSFAILAVGRNVVF